MKNYITISKYEVHKETFSSLTRLFIILSFIFLLFLICKIILF
jgi:hypothetical protein